MMTTQLVDAHNRNGRIRIPADIAEHVRELFPEHEDYEVILQYQESVYQSLQTNNRSNRVSASDHDRSSDQTPVSGNGGQFSSGESFDSQLALDEALARSLQEVEDGVENVSISESVGAAAGNTGANTSETSTVVASQDNVDPDTMSYEQLQSLGETIGTESRGLSEELISKLPSQKYKSGFFSKKIKFPECVICSMEFTKGEWFTTLHCTHQYHTHCIKRWLGDNKTCPVCMDDVSEP